MLLTVLFVVIAWDCLSCAHVHITIIRYSVMCIYILFCYSKDIVYNITTNATVLLREQHVSHDEMEQKCTRRTERRAQGERNHGTWAQ